MSSLNYLLEVELATTRVDRGKIVLNRVQIKTIKERVAAAYKIDVKTLEQKGGPRNPVTVGARQVGMFLGREMTNFSLSRIALAFGVADHTTVLYAAKKIVARMETDPKYHQAIEDLMADILAHTPA